MNDIVPEWHTPDEMVEYVKKSFFTPYDGNRSVYNTNKILDVAIPSLEVLEPVWNVLKEKLSYLPIAFNVVTAFATKVEIDPDRSKKLKDPPDGLEIKELVEHIKKTQEELEKEGIPTVLEIKIVMTLYCGIDISVYRDNVNLNEIKIIS